MYDNTKGQLLGGVAGYSQPPQPTQQSPIDQVLDELASSIQSGHEQLRDLASRLTSVLSSSVAKAAESSRPERINRCPQEARLQEMVRAVDELSIRMRDIREALCL